MTLRRYLLAAVLAVQTSPALAVSDAHVDRVGPAQVTVSWSDRGPVDVYVSERPDAALKSATLVARGDADGHVDFGEPDTARHYFLLRDRSGTVVRTAERMIPLDQGSNFRDLGGYPAAGGRHVRWGLIYRSGATPMLTEGDVARVKALGLHDMIDLRSSEERLLAPTKLTGIRYTAIDYPFMGMMTRTASSDGGYTYTNYPVYFASHLRVVFDDLLRHEGPVLYHCTAGQDRTGFTTAVILSALGVPRESIVADYHLSTVDRRPQWELDKISPALAESNPVAKFFAGYQQSGAMAKANPLYAKDGKPILDSAFTEIAKRWGSVDGYLVREVGLSKADLVRLRLLYLE